jgi:hypothetical protein
MTLSSAKLDHIDATVRRSWASRMQSVDLTLRHEDSSTSVLTVPAIWRVVQDADPSLGPAYGEGPASFGDVDVQAVFFVADVTYDQLRACIHAQLHPGQGQGMEPASSYTLAAITVHGIRPGGSRFLTQWIRRTP